MNRSKNRLTSVDTLRGISIIYMIIGHIGQYWLQRQDLWFYGLIFLFLEVIGANAFIFVAGIGLSLFYKSQEHKISMLPEYTRKHIHINFLTRTLLILVIGFITVMIGTAVIDELQFWAWYVLLTIGMARLISYPCLKLPPYIRVLIGFVFFIFADILRQTLSNGNPFLYYFLFNNLQSNPPFPYFGFFFIGTAIGDWIYNKQNIKIKNKLYDKNNLLKFTLIFGICSLVFGIITGLTPNSDVIARSIFWLINLNENINLTSLPEFLVRSSRAWSFYSLGIQLIILTFLLFHEIKREKDTEDLNGYQSDEVKKLKPRGVIIFGQYSLTIYLLHYLLSLIFPRWFSILGFLIAAPIVVFLIYILVWMWANKLQGKGSVEWLIRYISNHVLKRLG